MFINDVRSLDSSISKESEDDFVFCVSSDLRGKDVWRVFFKNPEKKQKIFPKTLKLLDFLRVFHLFLVHLLAQTSRSQRFLPALCVSAKEVVFSISRSHLQIELRITLQETSSSHLKIDGWKTILSFWKGLFSGANC